MTNVCRVDFVVPYGTVAGTAVLKFEQGELALTPLRGGDGLVCFHGREPSGPPLATTAAAGWRTGVAR